MSFFEFFRILFATHFVLGAYWALLLLRFVPAALGAITQPAMPIADVASGIAVSVLSLLWYFVWFGSIQFGLRGRFPLVSVRSFSMLLGGVYAGFGMVAYFESKKTISDFIFDHQEYLLVIFVMLLLSALGTLFLPALKRQADKEEGRIAEERDRRLDLLNPWGDSGVQASTQKATNNPLDRSGESAAS